MSDNNPSQTTTIWFWAGLLLLTVAAIAVRAKLLHNFPLTFDEGIHLMWLRLLSAGYKPYSEVYITYPPLYPAAIYAVWAVWPGEDVQRWFSVAYTIFGTVGIALLARQLSGTMAGIVAALLTLFSPILLEPSQSVLGEFPSVAWSVWAIWLALLYAYKNTDRRQLLLILSGLALSASLMTKLLSPLLVFLVPLILACRWIDFRDIKASFPQLKPATVDLFIWGLALLLPVVILFSIYDTNSIFEQVVDQRLKARVAYSADTLFWSPRYKWSSLFFREDPALVILALVGFWLAWRLRKKEMWIMTLWLGLNFSMLAIHDPVRYKHFLILIPPFAILGGVAISHLIGLIDRKRWVMSALTVTLLAGLSVWQIQTALTVWQAKANIPQPPTDELEALAFIESVIAPDDCLITDDMQLVYWSGRMVPPELAEVSSNRLKSGALTLEQLITISDKYDCQLVAAVSNRIPKYLPDYMDWVKGKYLGMFKYGTDDLFFAKVDTTPNPSIPLYADFDGQIIFHGYGLPQQPVTPGERIPLKLTWQAKIAPAIDYAIFVQLRNTDNITLATADHQPYNGLIPTSIWPEGAVIQEITWLTLPLDIPPGSYNIYVGLYRPDNLERLPIKGDTSAENALILGPVVVK